MAPLCSNPAPSGWAVEHLNAAADPSEPVPVKCTLVVVPANLLSQWEDEIKTHLEEGAVHWCTFVPPSDAAAGGATPGSAAGRRRRA